MVFLSCLLTRLPLSADLEERGRALAQVVSLPLLRTPHSGSFLRRTPCTSEVTSGRSRSAPSIVDSSLSMVGGVHPAATASRLTHSIPVEATLGRRSAAVVSCVAVEGSRMCILGGRGGVTAHDMARIGAEVECGKHHHVLGQVSATSFRAAQAVSKNPVGSVVRRSLYSSSVVMGGVTTPSHRLVRFRSNHSAPPCHSSLVILAEWINLLILLAK